MLDAARASFGKKGYAQTSVDEIAAAARVTKGAVYHHFTGKEACSAPSTPRSRARPRRARSRPGSGRAAGRPARGDDERLPGRRARRGDPADHADRRACAARAGAGRPARSSRRHREAVRSFIAAAIERGEIVDVDPDVLAAAHRGPGAAVRSAHRARPGDPDATRATLGRRRRRDAPRAGLHTESMFRSHGIPNAGNPARTPGVAVVR